MIRKNKGITLIALVITIIVMLILATVTISMVVNGGLFEYAGKATKDTELAKQEEQKLAEGKIGVAEKKYDSLDDYIDGVESGAEKFSAKYTEDANYTDKNGKVARIPKGFSVGTSEGINTVANGLVITDSVNNSGVSNGNEFVWVPVDDINDFTRVDWDQWSRTYDALIDINLQREDTTTDEYIAMKASVQKWKGFYIARYEAGTNTKRTAMNHLSTPDERPLSKKLLYPYINASTERTINVARGMYDSNSNYGVTSTLCYGVEYDCVMKFIQDEKDIYDSTLWGNYPCQNFEFIGEICQTGGEWVDLPVKIVGEYSEEVGMYIEGLLQTGAYEANKAKNIYDLAGNIAEITMEEGRVYFSYPSGHYSNWTHIYRGASFGGMTGGDFAAERCEDMSEACTEADGFRVALFITEVD